jgi:uncharacterized protein (TIGR00251 family)
MKIPFIKDKCGYILKIVVKTGSKTSGLYSIEEDKIKVKVKSQPYDGLANRELIEILSDLLDVPKSKIEIIKGNTSKNKIIRIKGDIN